MKQIKTIDFIEKLNANEMILINGGSSRKEEEIVIVYIGGKPYIIINGKMIPIG